MAEPHTPEPRELLKISAAARAAVQSEARLDVLLLLEENAWTAADLARELGARREKVVKRQAVVHHIRALVAAGLVEEVGREPISGGPLISYGACHSGWAEAVASLNAVVEPKGS